METIINSLKVLFKTATVIYAMYSGVDLNSSDLNEIKKDSSLKEIILPAKMKTINGSNNVIQINEIQHDPYLKPIKLYKRNTLINAEMKKIKPVRSFLISENRMISHKKVLLPLG